MKAAKEADDLEDMKAKKALEKVSQELAVKLYQQAQPEGGNDGAARGDNQVMMTLLMVRL